MKFIKLVIIGLIVNFSIFLCLSLNQIHGRNKYSHQFQLKPTSSFPHKTSRKMIDLKENLHSDNNNLTETSLSDILVERSDSPDSNSTLNMGQNSQIKENKKSQSVKSAINPVNDLSLINNNRNQIAKKYPLINENFKETNEKTIEQPTKSIRFVNNSIVSKILNRVDINKSQSLSSELKNDPNSGDNTNNNLNNVQYAHKIPDTRLKLKIHNHHEYDFINVSVKYQDFHTHKLNQTQNNVFSNSDSNKAKYEDGLVNTFVGLNFPKNADALDNKKSNRIDDSTIFKTSPHIHDKEITIEHEEIHNKYHSNYKKINVNQHKLSLLSDKDPKTKSIKEIVYPNNFFKVKNDQNEKRNTSETLKITKNLPLKENKNERIINNKVSEKLSSSISENPIKILIKDQQQIRNTRYESPRYPLRVNKYSHPKKISKENDGKNLKKYRNAYNSVPNEKLVNNSKALEISQNNGHSSSMNEKSIIYVNKLPIINKPKKSISLNCSNKQHLNSTTHVNDEQKKHKRENRRNNHTKENFSGNSKNSQEVMTKNISIGNLIDSIIRKKLDNGTIIKKNENNYEDSKGFHIEKTDKNFQNLNETIKNQLNKSNNFKFKENVNHKTDVGSHIDKPNDTYLVVPKEKIIIDEVHSYIKQKINNIEKLLSPVLLKGLIENLVSRILDEKLTNLKEEKKIIEVKTKSIEKTDMKEFKIVDDQIKNKNRAKEVNSKKMTILTPTDLNQSPKYEDVTYVHDLSIDEIKSNKKNTKKESINLFTLE